VDLRSLKLHFVDRHARVVLIDGAGAQRQPRDLDGALFDRVAEAARPLVAAITPPGAELRALSVEFADGAGPILRASLAEGAAVAALRLEGAALAPHVGLIGDVARVVLVAFRAPRAGEEGGPSVSDAAYWERTYREGTDGFELGRAAPPIVRWIDAHPELVRGARALVVGCGRGHEARALARAGASVVGVDFALDAITAARALAEREGVTVDFRQRDLFTLPGDGERYDLVVEHTCFCAIDPARRDEYVDVVAQLLVAGGHLVALFYAHGRPGGPPFGTTDDELAARFTPPRFVQLSSETPADSVARRAGEERLVVYRRA